MTAPAPPRVDPSPAPFAARFESVGVELPDQRLSTEQLMARVKPRVPVNLERLTGIREHRVCAAGEDSYTLSVEAARDCLRHSAHAAEDLEMIICSSISKFKDGLNFVYEPPLSLYVRDALGAGRAIAFDIANACAGMLTGVYIMADFIRRGVIRRGMVISGECITSISDNAAPRVTSILSHELASLSLGDCGAAVVVERSETGAGALTTAVFETLAGWSELCIGRACRDAPGGEMTTDGRGIHQAAMAASPAALARALEEWGVAYTEIDYLIPHQTSTGAIASGSRRMARHFHGSPRHVVVNLEEYGNTASTSHFLALYRLLNEHRFKLGDTVLLGALASGLVLGAVAFTMDGLAERYG